VSGVETNQLGGLEGDGGDLGGAVEAEGEADGAEAAVDVELSLAELEEAFDVLSAHGGENQRGEEGKPDLAAVAVAGEDEVGAAGVGMAQEGVGEVGLVAEDQQGGVELGGDGTVEVGGAGSGVAEAGEPEALAVALDGDELVDEGGDAVGGEGIQHGLGADVDVVVAEDGVAQRAVEVAEELAAASGGLEGVAEGAIAAGDEVTGEDDHVWLKRVDAVDGVFEEGVFGELFEMDVAELGDAEAVEGVGQAGDVDVAVEDLELVAGDLGGVDREASEGEAGSGEEFAAGEAGGGPAAGCGLGLQELGRVAGHSP
jgi:hypothetical protein